MGCCLSTTVTATPTKSLNQDVGTPKLSETDVKGGAKSPALVLDEEETIKEVLSETQTPISTAPKIPSTPNDRLKEVVIEEEQEEISVISELDSINGSFSTNTVNDGDEGGEVNQEIAHHSSAKKRSNPRVVARAKQGGLRSPGPSSKVKSRPAQGRRANSMVQQRNVGRRDRDWQGLVECSARRLGSVSEVIRHQRTAVPSVTGHPGGRSRVIKLEESKGIENQDGGISRESLDNPRVSLECFIFL